VRLLSYNIHKGIGGRDRRYRLERIIAVIEAEEPDIICLQEVDRGVRRSRYEDQPELLAEHFGAAGRAYQLNVTIKNGGYGNLLLSRWPMRACIDLDLKMGWRKARAAQIATLATPLGPLTVVNQHLGLAEHERRWQVARLLDAELLDPGHPTIVAGDFNDWRNTLAGAAFGPAGFRQVTAPPSRFRSFPAYMPAGSLDKAFVRGEIAVAGARIARSPIARDASDHLPLVVDLRIGEGANDDHSDRGTP